MWESVYTPLPSQSGTALGEPVDTKFSLRRLIGQESREAGERIKVGSLHLPFLLPDAPLLWAQFSFIPGEIHKIHIG